MSQSPISQAPIGQAPQATTECFVEDASAIETLAQGGAELEPNEVRRFPRFHLQSKVSATVYPFDAGAADPVQCTMLTRDVSRGGINLLHSDPLLLGQKIAVTLDAGSPRFVEVMWCRRLANRCYSLGCRFIRVSE